MNNKKTLLIIIVAFALLIGGASVLYNQLSQQQEAPDPLVTLPPRPTEPTTVPTPPVTQPTDPETKPTEPTTQPSEPTTDPTDPTDPTEPTTEPTKPATEPTEPVTQPSEPATEPTEPSKPQLAVPDFVVYDADGNSVRLSDLAGKPIVLNFWASWCGPCQAEMPHFQEMYEKLGDEVAFLMVNVTGGGNDSKAAAMSYIQKNGFTFPVFYDMDLDAAMTYGISSFPTTFFIYANGEAMGYVPGMLNAQQLEELINRIR
jgi:thiol-disulfide isomerase/thioredoxin